MARGPRAHRRLLDQRAGDPDDVIEAAKKYEATGADLLLCLVNPYKIAPDKVMQTIELMGKHVIPEFTKS